METGKILIVGRGYLAGRFAEYFGGRAMTSPVDVCNLAEVETVISDLRPIAVINAAAKTNTRALEQPEYQAEGYLVNVQGPANLAYACKKHGALFVQLSTGMMFDGDDVTEDALPDPASYYAWTKAWAEAELAPFADRDNILIARLHTPLSNQSNPRNLLNKLQGFSSVVDTPGSITVVEDLIAALDELIGKGATGIYNMTNPGSISMYEIIGMMKEHGLIASDKEVERVTLEQFEAKVAASGGAKQVFPVLNTDKLKAAGVTMRPVREAVEASIKEFTS